MWPSRHSVNLTLEVDTSSPNAHRVHGYIKAGTRLPPSRPLILRTAALPCVQDKTSAVLRGNNHPRHVLATVYPRRLVVETDGKVLGRIWDRTT